MNRLRLWLSTTGESWEGRVQAAIMLTSGGWSAAASWTHVASVAAAHGQGGWLAWADAASLELLSVAAGLDMRRRRRRGKNTTFPTCVLAVAVTLSVGAQLVQAEQSFVGWLAAACPAGVFLVMVKLTLGRMNTPSPEQVHGVDTPPVQPVNTPPVVNTPTIVNTPVSKPKRTITKVSSTPVHDGALARLVEEVDRNPKISDGALAKLTGMSRSTARRRRQELQAERVNGRVPELSNV